MTITDAPVGETRPFVEAEIGYTDPASDGTVLNAFDHKNSTFKNEYHKVRIHNARAAGPALSFDANGFTLVKHETDVDLLDKAAVQSRYFPQAAEIVRELTGASDVAVFLDLIRSEVRNEGVEVARTAHIDFNEASIRRLVRSLRPDNADELLKKRVININLWRPIEPVLRMPLAVCDARSVERDDLINIIIGGGESEGANANSAYNLSYNPGHRWYYYPNMQTDEVLVFKIYDSDARSAHLNAHIAFEDPSSPKDAPRRLSHEIRTIAFVD